MVQRTRTQARNLLRGDVIGTGETVVTVGAGARTPAGKVEVILERDGRHRMSLWGAYTQINVRRAESPHPVYGTPPIGHGDLERQPIQMLNRWHQRAMEASDEYFRTHSADQSDNDPLYDAIYNSKWDTFDAAFKASIERPQDLADLLQIIARHAGAFGDDEISLSVDRLTLLAAHAAKVAASRT